MTPVKKRGLKALLILFGVLFVSLVAVIGIAYMQQDRIVREMVNRLNQDFKGKLEINGSHISPFANFPYISIDLEDTKVYESKADTSEVLMQVKDTYIGFDLWTMISGSFEVKKIKMSNGFLKLIQHTDGSFNIVNALSIPEDSAPDTDTTSTHLDLQAIELINIDLLKLNEENNVLVEAFIENAYSSFKTNEESMDIALDSKFLFNLIIDQDTSFLHDKHLELHTVLNLDAKTNVLEISTSEVFIENALFLMDGTIDVDDNMNLDLNFSGNKPNFDLFLAFAPPELSPLLDRYDNGGKIYFDAAIKGPSINGYAPAIQVDFGCSDAFIHNTTVDKTVNDLYFEGHFTNGIKRDASTMELLIEDFSARPETGVFKGNILVKNFDSPEFDIQLISEFNLDFLAQFLNLDNLEDVTGFVSLEMNFHDIIDLSQPEKSIEKLNESYFTKLNVKNLNVTSTAYPLPIKNVNINAQMDGHKALIKQLDFSVGKSDL
ncbi:MAG: AsmA family protein, partial [Fulvivirga sp.]|nr:AsmA family protein [Fulvivirga sp.]